MKRYRMLSILIALIALTLFPTQSAKGSYAMLTARKLALNVKYMNAVDMFNDYGLDDYKVLLPVCRELIRLDHGETGEDCSKYVLYMESCLRLDQAAKDFAAFSADEYPHTRELANALFTVLQWQDTQNSGKQENPFTLLASVLGVQKESEISTLLMVNQNGLAMAANEREAFDRAWRTLRQAFAGFAYLSASDFPYAAQMILQLSPLLSRFDNISLQAEGESLLQEFWTADPQEADIKDNAPKYSGGK